MGAESQVYTVRDKVAVAGIGETRYYKYGGAPVSEFRLLCEAVLRAAGDAGLDVRQLDGFVSYSNDRNEPLRLAHALGIPDVAISDMVWGGGGGGVSASIGHAAAMLVAGYAKYVV